MSAFFSNPSEVLLSNEQPSISAANEMQTQSTNMNVQAQDQNAQQTLASAGQQAQQSAYQSAQQIGDQALAYSGSGVRLEGSPMVVLNKSRQLAIQSVGNILAQGANQANTQLVNAATTANQGRAALLGTTNKFETDLANSQITNYQQQGQQAAQIAQAVIAAATGGASAGADPFANGAPFSLNGTVPPSNTNGGMVP